MGVHWTVDNGDHVTVRGNGAEHMRHYRVTNGELFHYVHDDTTGNGDRPCSLSRAVPDPGGPVSCPMDRCDTAGYTAQGLLEHLEFVHGDHLPWRCTRLETRAPQEHPDPMRNTLPLATMAREKQARVDAAMDRHDRALEAMNDARQALGMTRIPSNYNPRPPLLAVNVKDVEDVRVLGLNREEVEALLCTSLQDWQWNVLHQLHNHHAG